MASTFTTLPVVAPSAGVGSFNGRVGAVVPTAGDYNASQITNVPAGNISATDVQAAINELDAEKGPTITGGASTIATVDLAANLALVSNASGKVAVSVTTLAELAFVSGVTSAIQTQLNNKQPLDATLTSLAAYNTNGLLTQTAADTFVGRTIAGTASNITVTNGDGVSGNPTIDLPNTAVVAGSYTSADITVDAKGRVTSATSGVPNLDFKSILFNDFTAPTNASLGSGLAESASGAGSGASPSTTGVDTTEKAIGVFSLASGTAAAGRTLIISDVSCMQLGNCSIEYTVRMMVPALVLVANSYQVTFGLIDDASNTAGHVDGVYFKFDNNGTATNWDIVTANNSTRTTTTTSTAVPLGTFHIYKIVVNAAGTSAEFFIDGVSVGTVATNLPAAGRFFGRGIAVKHTSSGASSLNYIDYELLALTWSGGR